MSPKLLLASAPLAKPCEPDPALLVLCGHLESQGVETEIYDANLKFVEELFSPPNLSSFAERVGGEVGSRAVATASRRASTHVAAALVKLKSQPVYDSFELYRSAVGELAEGFRLASRALGVHLSISDFTHPSLSPLSSEDLTAVGENPSLLGTADILKTAAREMVAKKPASIGISATYLSQALHAFALAGLVRAEGFEGPLILGGGVATSWRKNLSPKMGVFGIFDALVAGPGEEALTKIAKAGEIVPSAGVFAPSHGIWEEDFGADKRAVSFSPKARGVRWGDYLAPAPVLPVSASRGCYWARCAFCPEAAGDRQPYEAADADRLSEAILKAAHDFDAGFVHFTDNALSPVHLERFAENLKGSGVRWYGFARLEARLADPAFLEKLAAGGCAMLQLGVESASTRLLELMKKGIEPRRASAIVQNAHSAGIRVYGYFLFGMPTETADEARLTIEWIRERAQALTFLNLSLMNFPRGGEMEADPAQFGLETVSGRAGKNDLSLYLDYGGAETMERRELRRILSEAKRDPAIKKILLRTPPWFSSNHAAFAPLP